MLSNDTAMMQIAAGFKSVCLNHWQGGLPKSFDCWIPSRFGPFIGQEKGAGCTLAPQCDFK